MWKTAIQQCIGCPVRQECLEDAICGEDVGVVRGASWFSPSKPGIKVIPLVCEDCHIRPVVFTQSTIKRWCDICGRYRHQSP